VNVPVLERIVNFFVKSLLDLFAEHINVSFVNVLALLDE
jgi:hypothetical protein